MKKLFLFGAITTLAGIVLIAGSAMALPVLTLDDGVATAIIINDNSAGDAISSNGVIGYLGSVGGWDITMSMGSSYPALGTPGFPEMHLTGSTTSYSAGTLRFTFEDTFASWDSNLYGLVSAFGGLTLGGGNVNFSTYIDGVEMATFGPATGAFSESLSTLILPSDPTDFTLSIVGTIAHTSAGASSFDGGIAPVPEPATMLLLGSGLIGLASASRKKLFKNRG